MLLDSVEAKAARVQKLPLNARKDAFDHDKGQNSEISGHCLHRIFSNLDFPLSPAFSASFSKKSAPKREENCPQSGRHVSACHGSLVPKRGKFCGVVAGFRNQWLKGLSSVKALPNPVLDLSGGLTTVLNLAYWLKLGLKQLVKCGNRLCVGVYARNGSMSVFACRPFDEGSQQPSPLSTGNAKGPPIKRFSKMISLNAENLESALLAEPHVAVMFSCRTLTRSVKVSCRTLQIAEPKALNLEKDYLVEPWNAGSVRICPLALARTCYYGGQEIHAFWSYIP